MTTVTAHGTGQTRPRSRGTSHPHEATPGPSDAGCVVLDIGPGVGAAVVMTPDSLSGAEIEIRRAGEAWRGTHMAVRPRHGAGDTRYAAIFGSLPQGSYEFRVRGVFAATPALILQVQEGGVALAHWPVAESGGR
jgi:hypothetical protein